MYESKHFPLEMGFLLLVAKSILTVKKPMEKVKGFLCDLDPEQKYEKLTGPPSCGN